MKKLAAFFDPSKQSALLDSMLSVIQQSSYFTQLQPFIQVFGLARIHFIDGDALVENPGSEFTRIEQFFGFENELEFKFNEKKGFFCLHRPVPHCLPAAKGRTRGTHSKPLDQLLPDEMVIIRNAFRSEMKNLFRLVHPDLEIRVFCQEPNLYRFKWLDKYLCSANGQNIDVISNQTMGEIYEDIFRKNPSFGR